MANGEKNILDFDEATAPTGAERILVVQDNFTRTMDLDRVAEYAGGMKWAETEAEADAIGGAVLLVAPLREATDFSEYATGVQPSDWTEQWYTESADWTVEADASSPGGAYLAGNNTDSGRPALSWNRAHNPADVELLVMGTTVADGNAIALVARGSGGSSDGNGYAALVQRSSGNLRLARITNDSFTEVTTYYLGAIADTDNWWVRFRLIDTSIQIRAWRDGEAEPAAWQIEETDATHDSGFVGVWLNNPPFVYPYHVFAYALDGETAEAP